MSFGPLVSTVKQHLCYYKSPFELCWGVGSVFQEYIKSIFGLRNPEAFGFLVCFSPSEQTTLGIESEETVRQWLQCVQLLMSLCTHAWGFAAQEED